MAALKPRFPFRPQGNVSSSNGNNGQYDRERVMTADLAVVLNRWKDDYRAERPDNMLVSQEGRSMPEWTKERVFESATEHMIRVTGQSDRALRRILNSETLTTSFWLADRILTPLGLDLTGLIRVGTIRELDDDIIKIMRDPHVRQNVVMTQEEWFRFLDKVGCRR